MSFPGEVSACRLFTGDDQVTGGQHLRNLSVLHHPEQRLRLLGNRGWSLIVGNRTGSSSTVFLNIGQANGFYYYFSRGGNECI
jgi:hypothetical protein